MDKKEILEKAQSKKAVVGEMEKAKINKANWIALVATCVIAVAFMIIEGALGHFTAIYAIGAICFSWACIFYTCQYFMAKRPWQVLIGAVLEGLGAIAMIVVYILFNLGIL
ncbi:MAG: hypothetical protein IJX25_02380 [Clostridia bacterium]|nr:hypothetical protein [Clostridia bacterium]MBQ8792403.1 hypothetical protein [Clostridia bacterium]